MNKPFTWGRVIDYHQIKSGGKLWEIVEFHPRKREGCTITQHMDESKIEFHVEDLREGFYTIESAIAAILMKSREGREGIRLRLGLQEATE